MLPSTGYFKGINCPFYDNGLCERPYCHFRHVKKEPQNTANDTIESDEILQKLVSAAVQKVLRQSESSGATTTQSGTVDTSADINKITNNELPSKATYNPTPISELNKINNTDTENEEINEQRKRHIPVPYTPRKPASLPIKRPLDTNGSSKPFIYIPPAAKYTPGSTDTAKVDLYTPKGGVESTEKYLPGAEKELQEYTPNQNLKNQISSKLNYIPSDKAIVKKKVLEYKPTKLTAKNKVSSVTYQPTPRSLAPCFSSDEEEPCVKKRKVSSDFNGLDDLGPEFDILDQILDEEKTDQGVSNITKVDEFNSKMNDNKKEEKDLSRDKTKKASNKIVIDIKDKSETSKKEKHDSKSRNSHKKSSHKSSSVRKHKAQEECTVKHNEKHKHSSSKSLERHSENSSSTNSNKHTKHSKSSSSSKSELKNKDKSKHHKSHKSSRESKEKYKSSKSKKSSSKSSSNEVSHDHTDQDSSIQNEELGSDLYDISDSDEETRALECKRIFEEYVPTEKITIVEETVSKDENTQDNEYVPTKKRISRTIDKNIKIIPRKPTKPDYKVSAAQTMSERLTKVKEYHASKDISNSSNRTLISTTDLPKNTVISKIRIAHVPYASTLINAKKNISNCNVTKSEASTSSTVTQTVKKGTQRVAHIPNEKFIDRPGVLEPLASKIPANIRSTYLNMMIDESLKIYLSTSDAYARAQHEELTTSKKCSTIQIYKNSAVLAVSRLRKEAQECNGVKKSGADCSTLQKIPQTTSGNTSNNGSWSIESKNRSNAINIQEFSGARLYNNIHKWVLAEEQLHDNGFPRLHPSGEKGRAIIYGQNKQRPPKGYIRTCCRCKKEYTVDKKGFPAVKEECIYHPNNKYRVRGEARYQCCSQDATSDGCCIASSHVYEYVDYENLKGYVRTLPPETISDDYGVYSLDCEMCYTTQGLDLTRVTVINSACKVVYETLVKPLHPIIDYNTRYSGITEEQMAKVKTTLLEVQATLLAMFNSKTILIGHSLESDFKALKLIHDTVIDTSVLFPHKMGPPYKRALRNLSSEHLKKIIQNSVEGHDSAEDATVCMELIHYKLKEDLKTR